MKAAMLGDKGLEIRDIPAPKPKDNEILVRVRAAGLNRAEVMMAQGYHHGSQGGPGTVIGLEFSGEVVEAGAAVKDLRPAAASCAAATAAMPNMPWPMRERCSAIPANNMTFEQAATLPIGLQTMHDAIMTQGRMKKGDSRPDPRGRAPGVGIVGMQDRAAHGRAARHGHLDQAREARAIEGIWLRCRARSQGPALARPGTRGDRRQGRRCHRRSGLGRRHANENHEGESVSWAASSIRPARRLERASSIRPACAAPHRL